MKKIMTALIIAALLPAGARALEPVGEEALAVAVPSAVLMEKTTGELIYEKDAHTPGAPASVTKIMTLLLIMEEIGAGRLSPDDVVVCSSRAASMGGSQIWLEEGEQMTVDDMLKAVAVVSANDCAVALAEHVSGSEESFVRRMNARAAELGMTGTRFCDCTGLTDDPEHLTTAYDVALMSRELISCDLIKTYSTIWMDTLRNGEAELVNTNRLVRFYKGTTGLKTGFTRKAMYCLSATAERDGTEYIAVVMHGASSDERFESAKALLNFAFANYALCPLRSPKPLPPVCVTLGASDSVQPAYGGQESLLLEKSGLGELNYEFVLPQALEAPVAEGEQIGEMIVRSSGSELARVPLLAGSAVGRLKLFSLYGRMLARLFGS
ncbi:MAG: D-alanyl-D-alanine carboxypeptidase [Oscillospiraceae bacterium]|jgi:D-alanyl-D-alanine carboxypeptidase (penicillin-binding protein 5/6)|nr:D-alanyl-D-alanine carboxypeptidase [Oscillospiraceae bacterium]